MDELMDVPSSISRAQLAEMFAVIGLDTRYISRAVFTPGSVEITYVNDSVEMVKDIGVYHKKVIRFNG